MERITVVFPRGQEQRQNLFACFQRVPNLREVASLPLQWEDLRRVARSLSRGKYRDSFRGQKRSDFQTDEVALSNLGVFVSSGISNPYLNINVR